MSILLAMIRVGFMIGSRSAANWTVCSKSQFWKGFSSSPDFLKAWATWGRLAFMPDRLFAKASSSDEDDASRMMSCLLWLMISAIHISISISMSMTSCTGLPLPGWVMLPSASTEPDASTTWMRASACPMTERNLLPSPLPTQASLISPGTSRILTGAYRQPSMQAEFNGLSLTPSSLQTQTSQTYAVPIFGSFVVKG